MAEIRREHPEGRRLAEATLVQMLKERRCWNDYMDIIWALHNIRKVADDMKKESELILRGKPENTGANTK